MNKTIAYLTDHEDIKAWLDKHHVVNYDIKPDSSVAVWSHVILKEKNLSRLPVKFDKVFGNFDVSLNNLTTLENAPTYVEKSFSCSQNQLTSLSHGPISVGGSYFCSKNKITSLEGAPTEIQYNFDCSDNLLKDLKGVPQIINKSLKAQNNQLTHLTGFPKVGGHILLGNNLITSIKGLPQICEEGLHLENNQLASLDGLPLVIKNLLDLTGNQLTPKGLLPLFKARHINVILLEENEELKPYNLAKDMHLSGFKNAYAVWLEKENIKKNKKELEQKINKKLITPSLVKPNQKHKI